MKNTAMCEAKSPVGLGLAALRVHQETGYRMWLLARAIDADGKGWVTKANLHIAAKRHLRCSGKTVMRTLDAGEPDWWSRVGDRVYLAGLQSVSERLDVYRCSAVVLPLSRFARIGDFRATLVAALFADGPREISVQKLCELTNRTRRTIQGWRSRANLRVTPNYAVTAVPVADFGPELARRGYIVDRSGKEPRLLRRLSNTYACETPKPISMPALMKIPPRSYIPDSGPLRRFFDDAQAAQKALARLPYGTTVFVRTKERAANGSRLWEAVVTLNRELQRAWSDSTCLPEDNTCT